MARDLGQDPPTFAVGVEEQAFDELPFAREVAESFSTRHVERRVTSDLIRELPRMIWHLDEPSDPIAACQYYAARLASESVKVVLGGDGGDELFGGFDRYWGIERVERYKMLPGPLRNALVPLASGLADSFAYKGLSQKLAWLERLASVDAPSRRYAEATCFFRFNQDGLRELFADGSEFARQDYDPASMLASVYDEAPAGTSLDRMLYTDIVTRLPEHSLMLTDRMSMASSLELRTPFLDHRLMEFMASAPPEQKLRGRRTKYLLRRLAADYLPRRIAERDKQGFMFPIADWFSGSLHGFLRDMLLGSRFINDGVFREQAVLRLLNEHRDRKTDHHVRLWQLLNLEIWAHMYLEGASVEHVEGDIEERL
jgi:asparagine synthase (glutamine-hydrolysing)